MIPIALRATVRFMLSCRHRRGRCQAYATGNRRYRRRSGRNRWTVHCSVDGVSCEAQEASSAITPNAARKRM
jgi:hypothetical protein